MPATVAAIVPCHRVRRHILPLLRALEPAVDIIVVVDDSCPEGTARHVAAGFRSPKLRLLLRPENGGVGAATVSGYRAALSEGCQLFVKLDGDGQMAPADIPALLQPLRAGQADYAKGDRLSRPGDIRAMPRSRRFGNRLITALLRPLLRPAQASDPMNGFTAITRDCLLRLPLEATDRRYFFEIDMLLQVVAAGGRVADVAMPARYGGERSGLTVGHIVCRFPFLLLQRAASRQALRVKLQRGRDRPGRAPSDNETG